MATTKTNAVRLLERLGIPFELRAYEVDPEDLAAETVARKVGLPPEQVFKTLVARGDKHGVCLAVVPGDCELDLKALAKATGDKKTDTVPLKEVEPLTGYIRGGVTALACKKPYPVYLDETAQLFDVISISAGMRGLQILIAPDDLHPGREGQGRLDCQEQGVAPMPEILHITTPQTWQQAVAQGEYRAEKLETEGFIHFSTSKQLPRVAETFYKDQEGLVVLRVNTQMLNSPLKWESPPDSEERFPHLHGPLNLDAVTKVETLEDVLAE